MVLGQEMIMPVAKIDWTNALDQLTEGLPGAVLLSMLKPEVKLMSNCRMMVLNRPA